MSTQKRVRDNSVSFFQITLWCQLEDMFQLIVTPQGIEKVTIQLIDTPTRVYAIYAIIGGQAPSAHGRGSTFFSARGGSGGGSPGKKISSNF